MQNLIFGVYTKKSKLPKVIKQLESLGNDELFFDYNVDLVCYPFLSNIQVIEKNIDLLLILIQK